MSILIFFLAGASAFLLNSQFNNRVHTIFDMGYQSNSERVLLWKSSIHMFEEYPITGVGLGNFTKLYQEKYILPEAVERNLGHAHNNILHVLVETGIFGALAYIGMFGYFLYESYLRWRRQGCWEALVFFLATAGFLLQGMTEFNLYPKPDVMRTYWMLLGLYLVSCNAVDRE